MIKKTIVNIITTTGAALMLLAFFFAISGGGVINVRTFFEIFGANIVIDFGILLTHKFESGYAVLEYLIDVSYIIAVLMCFGFLFGWFSSIPIWYLIIVGVAVYLFAIITNLVRNHKDAKEINDLLQKRKEEKL
jgi:4-hydroxybenzoate polyprenyltransferase